MTPFTLELMADQLEELKQEQSLLAAAPVHAHHTHCLRCGRALGNPKSQQLGLGPVCARKAKAEAERAAKYLAAKAARETQPEASAEPLAIDVKPGADGKWYVIAHTEAGDCHDVFGTQQDALMFALDFYGGTVVDHSEAAA